MCEVTGQHPLTTVCTGLAITVWAVHPFYVVEHIQLEARCTASHGTSPCHLLTAYQLDGETAGLLRVQKLQKYNNPHSTMASSASPSSATFGNDSSEGSNGLMALPAAMDMVADSQDEPGSGGSALFSDVSTPARSWNQVAIHQESKQRDSPPRRSSSSPATPRASQKSVRSASKGGRSKSPTSADFRAAIKEKNKMEMEIGEYQKTLVEMSAAMANLHQEDYGSTIRIQELERRCEIASKQSMNPNDAGAARLELAHMGHKQGEIDAVFGRCDGWYRPWCIRVTTGHSDFGFMNSSALVNRYSARMGDALGGAFHVTYVENLPGIVRCGLVPAESVAGTDWHCTSGHSLHGTRRTWRRRRRCATCGLGIRSQSSTFPVRLSHGMELELRSTGRLWSSM